MNAQQYAGGGSGRGRLAPLLIILVVLCCLVAAATIAGYFFFRPQPVEARPVVLIESPAPGSRVEVGQMVTVRAVARDPAKITRIELWVNGELIAAQSSTLPRGTSPFPLTTYWTPGSPGSYTLSARAFNAQGTHAHSSIVVEAFALADGDEDGVADDADACPSEPGSPLADGCADRDGDGVADGEDSCPDEAGLPATGGCPAPADTDRDGDGMSDEADACPDTPGAPRTAGCPDADGDGVGDGVDSCPDEAGPADDGCPAPVESDRDGDGIADDVDDCPDEPGLPETDGCPDADGDGIPDDRDACPDEPGGIGGDDGCPAPSDGDRDGDGIPDEEDMCPDEPGVPWTWGCPDTDGDGVRDSEDLCPDEPGAPENRGCPVPGEEGSDRDGDGVPDAEDTCPDEWGLPESEGCPDDDGDGVFGFHDLCPEEPGPPESAGCPDTGAGDRDGDGVPDDVDLCPDEAGLPEDGGCPPPGEGDDTDGDGIPDDEEGEGVFPGEIPPMGFPARVLVEFQALEFEVGNEYDTVSCYARLGGGAVERYTFDPLDERRWDITAELGSRVAMMNEGEPLDVYVECNGETLFLGPGDMWGTYYDLGMVSSSHPDTDWDGHIITVRSSGGDEDQWFQASYRICAGSCSGTAFPSPVLSLFGGSEDRYLAWLWEGDRELLEEYRVYMDGNLISRVEPGIGSTSVAAYEPLCGTEGHEFYITAYGSGVESPPSNSVVIHSQPCPRQVRVTFEQLRTLGLGDDEWWADDVGPIFGHFEAVGSTSAEISFNAVDYPEWWGERIHGYRLRSFHDYVVQDILNWIQREASSCIGGGCPRYSGSEVNFVTIQVGAYDDLTFGGVVYDADSGNPSDTLFDGEYTMPAEEVRPGRYTFRDRNIELTVLVDVIVGPEAGALPDLVITDLTAEETSGQLRIHVFNNAANLVDAELSVHIVRVSTNESLALPVWQHVNIPSGGAVILQSSELVMEPTDLRVIVDPDNQIAEMNEGNNIYETPVVLRIEPLEFLSGRAGENLFQCTAEGYFRVLVGHGPSAEEVVWSSPTRYPASGHFSYVVDNPLWCHRDDPGPWLGTGFIDITMPPGENLYLSIRGWEEDWASSDDYLGEIWVEYTPYEDYGEGTSDWVESTGGHCDDARPYGSPSFQAHWRITRLR